MVAEFSSLDTRSVNDFLIEIEHSRSFHELHFQAVEVASQYDFQLLCIVRLPLKQAGDVNANLLVGNIPPSWLSDEESPVARLIVHAVRKAGNGINFAHIDLETDKAAVRVLPGGLTAGGAELTDACIFPVHSSSGARGMAMFLGNSRAARSGRMFELNYLAAQLFEKSSKLASRDGPKTRLTKREVECLHWTAAGKTSAEIATILDLSEHTINNYLVAVCQKLNSVNRAHAVAKAMRQGIIG